MADLPSYIVIHSGGVCNENSLNYRLDSDSALEYDCNTDADGTDYCVHFMSRTPTMEQDKLDTLMAFVGE